MADPLDVFEPEPHGGTHQWFVGVLAVCFILAVVSVLAFGRSGMDHDGVSSESGGMSQMGHEPSRP